MYVRLHAYTGLGSALPANQKVQPNVHMSLGGLHVLLLSPVKSYLSANQKVQPQQIRFHANLPK